MLEVGRIAKPHGIRGDVIVELITNRAERVASGAVLHAGERAFRVEASRPHQGRWIVTFEGVLDRNTAESLRDTVLSAEPLDDPDELWVHELLGSLVVDQDGVERGTVSEVHQGAAADLLLLDTGHLVPVTFVVGKEPGRILVDVPDGLWEV